MKVSGFTIIRNAVQYDYPVVESITSVLPLCDEFIVSIGQSGDSTLSLIQSIASSKIKIVHSVWDDQLREGGRLLAVETNKAKQHIAPDSDWCFYIQADEVLPENYFPVIRQALQHYTNEQTIEGLLFQYKHFYGSYEYVADAYNWYRNEIRIIRNRPEITSWGDAQGFRIKTVEGKYRKLNVKPIDAFIYHYGWVKNPVAQQRKQENFHQMWHDDDWIKSNVLKADEFDYETIDSLQKFSGTHPKVMQNRIAKQDWVFQFDTSKSRMKLKYRIRKWLNKNLGITIGEYKNYRLM